MSSFGYNKAKHKSTAWMADRFQELAMQESQLQNRWLPASIFFDILEEDEYPDERGKEEKKEFDKFNMTNFIRSIHKKHRNTMHLFDGLHDGVLMHANRVKTPSGPQQEAFFYFVTSPGTKVKKPKLGSTFQNSQLSQIRKRRRKKQQQASSVESVQPDNQTVLKDSENFNITVCSTADTEKSGQPDSKIQATGKRPKLAAVTLRLQTAWESTEFKNIFRPLGNESVEACLVRRISDLVHVNHGERHWIDIVDNHDKDGLCTPDHIFHLRHKCTLLAKIYQIALDLMGNRTTFRTCCLKAINDYRSLGYDRITSPATIELWNRWFRVNENFPCPTSRKLKEPLLFQLFPIGKQKLLEWVFDHMAELTVTTFRQHLVHTFLPFLKDEMEHALNEVYSASQVAYLERLIANPPSEGTARNWLKNLGFLYDTKKKTFYVDGHEKPEQRFSRLEFSKRYLTELEPYMRRWVQVTECEVDYWVEKKFIHPKHKEAGYQYVGEDGTTIMYEFHVDTCEYIYDTFAGPSGQFKYGGFPSVRREDKTRNPLMVWGQDESIFHQYMIKEKHWVHGPSGKRPILPKSQGATLMVSAFVSREFGFGKEISESDLLIINEARRGQKYKDGSAAIEILKSDIKPPLTESPFVQYLDVGENREGYWNYNHMIIQFEDCVDCLQEIHKGNDFIFLFDHSSGHAKKRVGGLDAAKMNVKHGGMQPRMHPSKIEKEDGYLGPFERVLEVGATQRFVWVEGDTGPFYLSDGEKEKQRFDWFESSGAIVDKTKQELSDELNENQINKIDPKKFKLAELQDLATLKGIEFTKRKETKRPGWVGAPKGLLQVLWERGWIEEKLYKKYHLYTTDAYNNPIDELSLIPLMSSCLDFAEEITELQAKAQQMEVQCLLTPKYHCELAGEGIEFAWGVAKARYRAASMEEKRSVPAFRNLVRRCLSRTDGGLPVRLIRRFSVKARAYICAYYAYETTHENGTVRTAARRAMLTEGSESQLDITPSLPPLNHQEVQKLMKKFKVHRGALDFDKGFILRCIVEIDDAS